MHRRHLLALALLLGTTTGLTACGSDDGTGPTPGGSKSMHATVAGADWTANPLGITAVRPGAGLNITGTDLKAGTTTQISINLLNVPGPGTYQLNPSVTGQLALLTISTGASPATWTTALSPGTGSITITTLTAERVIGTFSFTAQTSGAPATGQRVVGSGQFNIAF